MSIACLSWVMEHSEAQLGARLVLFVLAEHAHNDGTESYPSVPSIAHEARLSRRSVQSALRKLEADGMIRNDGVAANGQTRWIVIMEGGADSAPPGDRGGEDTAPGGRSSRHEGGADIAPKPSVKPSKEPTTSSSSAAGTREAELSEAMAIDVAELLRRKTKVDSKLVTPAEMEIAAAALEEFNLQMGSDYGLGANLRAVVMRIRERPSWDAAKHRRLVQSAWRLKWWERSGNRRRATPAVIYGNERVFEQVAQDAMNEAEALAAAAQDLGLTNKVWPDGRRWTELTPTEQAHAREAVAMGMKPWESPEHHERMRAAAGPVRTFSAETLMAGTHPDDEVQHAA